MNNDVRKRIDLIMKDIENAASIRAEIDELLEQATAKLEDYKEVFDDARNMIEEIKDEEQEKFDNLSEGLQQSERGQNLEAAVSALETAMEAAGEYAELEGFIVETDPDDIIQSLDEAKGY